MRALSGTMTWPPAAGHPGLGAAQCPAVAGPRTKRGARWRSMTAPPCARRAVSSRRSRCNASSAGSPSPAGTCATSSASPAAIHGVTLSYSFVKLALQEAGLVRKGRARGRHRCGREPRPCFGELLHLDGSRHAWLRLAPGSKQTFIAIIDDATKRLLYAQLCAVETTEAVVRALPRCLYHPRPADRPVHRSRRVGLYTPMQGAADLGGAGASTLPPAARRRGERRTATIQRIDELRARGRHRHRVELRREDLSGRLLLPTAAIG